MGSIGIREGLHVFVMFGVDVAGVFPSAEILVVPDFVVRNGL